MTGNAQSDENLMARLAAQDEEAFATLLSRHLENVRGLAWRILASHEDVDDIAQDVFLKLWRNPTGFTPGKAKFSTWLYRVTLNACIDRQRKTKTIPLEIIEPFQADKAPNPEANAISSTRATRVNSAIAQLPERQRQAISLSHFQGLGNIETADVLDTTVEAVESLLGRARRSLKASLKNDIDELLEGMGS
jgi:RNA polymerase sigma-70 factor (ECF subfamily)